MEKIIIENNDVIFATGVYLKRDKNNNGGFVVEGFEDDSFLNGYIVESEQTSDNSVEYYIEKE